MGVMRCIGSLIRIRPTLAAIAALALAPTNDRSALAQSQQTQVQSAPGTQAQPVQTPQSSAGRLPGVRLWNMRSITPDEHARQMQSRQAPPNLVNPNGSAE